MGDTPQTTQALAQAEERQTTPAKMYDETRSYFPALPATDPLNRVWSFAKMVAGARFIKEEYRNDEKSIAFISMRGFELGLPLTQALQSLYMTPDGKLGMQGDAMLALLLSKGFKVTFPEHTKEKAVCRIIRPGETAEDAHQEEFTWEDASNIVTGYQWDKNKNQPDFSRPKILTDKANWKNYPKNMLMWRALSNCARFKATDVISGIYLQDEIEDFDAPAAAPPAPEPPEGKYTVTAKAAVVEAAPEPAVTPATAPNGAVAAEPKQQKPKKAEAATPPPAPAPAPQAPPPTPEEGKVVFEIHVLKDGAPVLTNEKPQTSRQAAELMAQAMANTTGIIHEVVSNAAGERLSKGKFYPAASKVVEMPTPPPPATEPPQPAPPLPPAAQERAVLGPMRARLMGIAQTVSSDPAAKNLPEKTAQARIQTFLVSYLGVKGAKELKELPDEAYADALADLESLAQQDVNTLLSEPAEAGKRLAASNAGFTLIWNNTKWKPETCSLARQVARRYGQTAEDFQAFIEGNQFGQSLDFMDESIVAAYFRLAFRTRSAGQLLKAAIGHNLDFLACIKQIEERGTGGPVETADIKILDAAILQFVAKAKEIAASQKTATASKPTVAPPPPPPPPPAVEEEGGLFDED